MQLLLKVSLATLILLPLSVSVHAETDKDAIVWLEKMANAVKTLNYEGNFVYAHGKQLELMRIIHSVDESGTHERLVSLSGEAREILRDDDALTCILPNSRSVIVEKSRPKQYIPEALLDITNNLAPYYEFKVLGEDRMTGRTARVVAVSPKDPYRYGYRLWLDEKTGMLLKSDLMNENGEAVEQFMFTSLVVYNSIPLSRLEPTTSGKGFKWYEDKPVEDSKPKKKMGWVVTKLPGGFKMTMQKEHGIPTSKMPVEHMVFTDGLTSVSVFIEKPETNSEDVLKGTSHMGAVNAFGTMISNHNVTVVGEVPKAAVMMIGESVRYVK